MEYGLIPYRVQVKHSERNVNERVSSAELKMADETYSVNANMNLDQPKQLFVEMHIDK